MWSRHYIGLYAHALASGLLSGSITSASSYCTYVYKGSRTFTHPFSLSIDSLEASHTFSLCQSIQWMHRTYTLFFSVDQLTRCIETHGTPPPFCAANLCSNSWNIMTIAYNFSVLFGLFSECWRPFGMRRKYVTSPFFCLYVHLCGISFPCTFVW